MNVLHFIPKEEWPPSSQNLNPLEFGIWSYLESKGFGHSPSKFGSTEGETAEQVGQIPKKVVRDTFKDFHKCVRIVINAVVKISNNT